MQPLRGYDSLSLGDLLQGIAPASLSPPNMPDAWNAPNPGSSSIMAPQANTAPPRQSGITRESLAALKQAMARIAPHLPPDLLQRHYINRLGQLSNPTPETLYPVRSYDTPFATGDRMSEIKPSPLLDPNMPTGKDNPFVRAAMARFAASSGANRLLQPVSAEDAPLSPGDLLSNVKPPPLSAPNIPSEMDNPFVRAVMARVADTSDAGRSIQPIREYGAPPSADENRRRAQPAALTVADDDGSSYSQATRAPYSDSSSPIEPPSNGSIGEPGFLESLIPVWGSGRAAVNDFQNGDYAWAALNGALAASDVFLVNSALRGIAKGALKAGGHSWTATRNWMAKTRGADGKFAKGTEVHHWAIPQKRIKEDPEWAKYANQPWNLIIFPDRATHNLAHGWSKGPLRRPKQFWYGTPHWTKATGAYAGGDIGKVYDSFDDPDGSQDQ